MVLGGLVGRVMTALIVNMLEALEREQDRRGLVGDLTGHARLPVAGSGMFRTEESRGAPRRKLNQHVGPPQASTRVTWSLIPEVTAAKYPSSFTCSSLDAPSA